MGRFHPIWPLSVTDGIHSEPVMHLCRELTDPPRGWQQVLQYRWHGSPPSCQVPRLVTRMLACLLHPPHAADHRMPSLPGHAVDATREGILEDNIAPPASWLPLPGHFSLQGCGYRAVSGRCGYQRIICPRKSAPRAVFVLFCEFMARISVVFMAAPKWVG